MNVGKVQSVHIFALSDQSWCFDVGVLPFSSIFCPLILPFVLPSSTFALYFVLIFCPLEERGQGQGQKMREKYRANVVLM